MNMPPQADINNSDAPARVLIAVSRMRVQNAEIPPRVVLPTATHAVVPNSHRILPPNPCRAVTHNTPYNMVKRSAACPMHLVTVK
jgi:hypothetical protein